jgi:hypothetical protein
MTNKSELDELRAKIDALERQQRQLTPPSYPTEAEVAAHRDKMHELAERRATASAMVGFSRADLAAMRAAAPDDVCRDLARDGRAPLIPKPVIPESEWNVRGRVSSGTGWANPTAIKNGLGQGR